MQPKSFCKLSFAQIGIETEDEAKTEDWAPKTPTTQMMLALWKHSANWRVLSLVVAHVMATPYAVVVAVLLLAFSCIFSKRWIALSGCNVIKLRDKNFERAFGKQNDGEADKEHKKGKYWVSI